MEKRKGGGSVSDGTGLMFCRKVEYSRETQDLLNRMMKESRLTNLQQRQIGDRIKNGQGLPAAAMVCSTSKDTAHQHNRMSGRPYQGMVRPTGDSSPLGKGLRSKDTIRKINEMADETASPAGSSPKYNSSVEKERLHNIMAFGKDKVTNEDKKAAASHRKDNSISGLQDNDDDDEGSSQRFEEVVKEIEERREFLKDMAELGMQHKYRAQIETEISQRIRELELLNK